MRAAWYRRLRHIGVSPLGSRGVLARAPDTKVRWPRAQSRVSVGAVWGNCREPQLLSVTRVPQILSHKSRNAAGNPTSAGAQLARSRKVARRKVTPTHTATAATTSTSTVSPPPTDDRARL